MRPWRYVVDPAPSNSPPGVSTGAIRPDAQNAAAPIPPGGGVVGLRIPVLDPEVIPSYRIAQHAHRLVLTGFALVFGLALLCSFIFEMNLTVAANGGIEPAKVWSVRPLEPGVLVELLVHTGDTVTRGAPVALLDRFAAAGQQRELTLQIRERRADLAHSIRVLPLTLLEQEERIGGLEAAVLRARAALRERVVQSTMRANVDSVLARYVPGTSTQLDLAIADLHAADAELRAGRLAASRIRVDSLDLVRQRYELDRLEDQLDRLRQHDSRLTVLAPSDGVILTDQLERRVGVYVQSGEQILEIADVRGWHASLLVGERDVHNVARGQPATIQIPALKTLDGRQLRGHVTAVAPEPMTAGAGSLVAAGSGTGYRVTVAFDPGQLAIVGTDALRTGYAVQGRVVTRSGRIADLAVAAFRDWLNEHRTW